MHGAFLGQLARSQRQARCVACMVGEFSTKLPPLSSTPIGGGGSKTGCFVIGVAITVREHQISLSTYFLTLKSKLIWLLHIIAQPEVARWRVCRLGKDDPQYWR